MSQLLQLRAAICAAITPLLPSWDIAGHLGRFTEEQLADFLVKAPAVRVAVLGISDIRAVSDDGIDCAVQVGIYIVTKDGATKLSRDELAIAAVEAVLKLCDRNRWGLGAFCKESEPRGAQNLFTQKALGNAVALWAIDMRQPMRLTNVTAAELDLGLWLGMAPNIGAGHQDDYVLLAGEAPP